MTVLRTVVVSGYELQCQQCAYTWITIARELPDHCANKDCRSREWNGKKKRRRPTEERIVMPKPKRITNTQKDQDFYGL